MCVCVCMFCSLYYGAAELLQVIGGDDFLNLSLFFSTDKEVRGVAAPAGTIMHFLQIRRD